MKKVLLVFVLMLVASSAFARGRRPGRVGPTGPQGEPGQNGQNGQNGLNGKDGNDYEPHTQIVGEVAVRALDSQRLSVYGFAAHNFADPEFNSVGARLVVKLGRSWEEQQIEELKKTIEELRSVAHRPGRHQENYYREKPVYLDNHHRRK